MKWKKCKKWRWGCDNMERGSRMKWVGEKTNIGKHRGKKKTQNEGDKIGGWPAWLPVNHIIAQQKHQNNKGNH